MRRYVYILLFLLALGTPFLLRRAVTRAQPSVPAAGGDAARLVVVTPHNQDIRREFARAFSEWHQRRFGRAVDMDYRVPGGTNDIKRQLETHYRGYQRAGR